MPRRIQRLAARAATGKRRPTPLAGRNSVGSIDAGRFEPPDPAIGRLIGKIGQPNDDERQGFVELTQEQQRLAELIQNMIGEPGDTATPGSAPKPAPDDKHKQP